MGDSKRRKTEVDKVVRYVSARVGAPSQEDTRQAAALSASGVSTRTLPASRVLPLTTYCARGFIASLQGLTKDSPIWDIQQPYLEALPDHIIPKLFAMMRAEVPEKLISSFIIKYFLRGPSITLSDDLAHVKRETIAAVANAGPTLIELKVTGFPKVAPSVWVTLLKELPSLQSVNLRGCSKVGADTVATIIRSCPNIKAVNLSQTSVTPVSVAELVLARRNLEVLKLAGFPNWTDGTFARFLSAIGQESDFSLPKLRTLKLRQTALTEASILPLLLAAPNLQRLDLAFTGLRRLRWPADTPVPPLEKLSLTSTGLPADDVLAIVGELPRLQVLALGALGASHGRSAGVSNSSAFTMNEDMLTQLTGILETYKDVEVVTLVGNAKLGMGVRRDTAVADFMRRVGRRCKTVNLVAIPSVRGSDLEGLLAEPGEEPPKIETLLLNNTSVGDDAAPFISACEHLRTLEVASTKFTSEGLFTIIDACHQLDTVNLTSCRGVRLHDRRQFFEVWQKERIR